MGCLNTLRLFSLGGELVLIFFLFLAEEIASKMKATFRRFEENGYVHPDLGPPGGIFALTFLMEIGQWPQPESQK